MNRAGNDRNTGMICLLLAVITFALYWPVRSHDFINFDDPDYIYDTPLVSRGITWPGIVWAFTGSHSTNWHPLTTLSHMLDCTLFALDAGAHHTISLLWHTGAAVLLFLALQRLTGAVWRSALVAALFAWHPLHVESVAWLAERKDVLSAFFFMLTLLLYARYVESPSRPRYFAALTSFAVALMCKPMVVTLPFVLLLLDAWPLQRWRLAWPLRIPRALVREKLPFFALTVISSLVTFFVQKSGGAVVPQAELPVSMRLANAVVAYGRYLYKTFWPSDLALYYPYPPGWPAGTVALAVLLLIGVTVLAVRFAARRPYLPVGWFWFLGMLVPVIGLVQTGSQSMANRYTYLPLTGIFIALAWGMHELWEQLPRARVVLAASALAACLTLTSLELRHWRNSETRFARDLQVTKDNLVAHLNLGMAVDARGRTDEAIAHYREALRINADDAMVHLDLGTVLDKQGKTAEALAHYERALQLNPNLAEAHNSLGTLLDQQGHMDAALQRFNEALRLRPDFPKAHNNLALVLVRQGRVDEALSHYIRALDLNPRLAEAHAGVGFVLAMQHRREQAMLHFGEALRLNPELADAHSGLALALAAQNQLARAMEHFRAAAKFAPRDPQLRHQLGLALLQQNQIPAALVEFREAARLSPSWPTPLNTEASVLATHADATVRDGAAAVKLAERACELAKTPQPAFLNTLAAAYAEAGRFEDAVETARKALALATASNQAGLATQLQERLQLYQNQRPYHEPPR